MNQLQTTSNINTGETHRTAKEKAVVQLEISLIVYILRTLSSKEHPMYVSEIANRMMDLTGYTHEEKTIRRKLQILCETQADEDDELLTSSLFLTLGGRIMTVTNELSAKKKVQTKYYFQPLLETSDVSMICGAITSNRYLNEDEKTYLVHREKLLAPLTEQVNTVDEKITHPDGKIERRTYYSFSQDALPEKPIQKHPSANSNVNFLQHVNQLHEAIENGYAVKVTYGIYTLKSEQSHQIQFQPRNLQAYLLNPYALLWNGGFYYLLATHKGHENPVHFRVDRIISIEPLIQEDAPNSYEPRAALPPILKRYFKKSESQTPIFQADLYTATYPLMGIYNETDSINCQLECTAGTLSILIDTFGRELHIQPSPIIHRDDELDIHGKPQQFYAVTIRNVQYDNLLQFCLQQHTSITAISPSRLVQDIEAELISALNRCRNVQTIKPL